MEMAAETAKRFFVNAQFIHSILFDRGLFSICFNCLYIKKQLISTAL